jgi:hypothetical protein
MSGEDFITKIKNHKDFELKDELKDSYVIFNSKTNRKYKLTKDYLEKADWTNLENVLTGREPIIMDGITRIVGYFSKISNWNKSKLGELDDRRRGNYKV